MAHVRSLFFEGPLAEVEDKAIAAYRSGRPGEIIWNITNRCNLLCDHCYMGADGHAKPEQLSDDETLDLVGQMGDLGVPLLFLSGGEPMLRSNFWEILEAARARAMRVTVSTNATQIDRAAAQRLRDNGVDWIATSLYGPAEFHDAMVQVPGTRAKVVEAIRTLREAGVGVALKTAVSRDTWPFIFDLIAEAKELDCGLIYMCDLITSGRSEGEDDLRISDEQWRELADFVLEDILDPASTLEYDIGALPSVIPYLAGRLKERGIDVTRGLERLKVVSACPVGKGHMNINSEGGIMPCQFAQDWVVGDVREMSLADATRKLFELDTQDASGACSEESCDYARVCRGCRTKAYHEFGDPMAEDTTCILGKKSPKARAHKVAVARNVGPCGSTGACG